MFADSCRINELTYPFYYVNRELYTLRCKGCCHIIEKSMCLIWLCCHNVIKEGKAPTARQPGLSPLFSSSLLHVEEVVTERTNININSTSSSSVSTRELTFVGLTNISQVEATRKVTQKHMSPLSHTWITPLHTYPSFPHLGGNWALIILCVSLITNIQDAVNQH